ncbi:MAG: hypothetical protein CL537_09350 [Alcanivoracaceae bacterium]|uniref:hypothetical protein n=1 Tax=Alcanivorax sp. MD8A TaxID=1177157 RepID=UPI000C52DFC8|nr:hypothetical protein [Alcanivorax sp. MD8A]MAX55696.1 hypothetical protein [Alcanivoracaceae bacterium]MCG8436876.1 hypothetical protein [Pseudomonadales bacterium]MED5432397.1 hypothetical protein [Pseudomonadota bacterium]MEE2869706.1 hypothetical protein [Pseudomonadota bacterium]PNE03710.1 hypothetical protein A15D_00626 [Alcanivorax sp. MD8A]|tara:strand:- start:4710 stop:5006 length:297 start_codon:yes stop_codon:yes gene_type:complete
MKMLTLMGLLSTLVVIVAFQYGSSPSDSYRHAGMPAPADIIPAMPRSPHILQRANSLPVHFNAFETINLHDDDGIEFGISVQELNLHLVNQKTGNRLI